MAVEIFFEHYQLITLFSVTPPLHHNPPIPFLVFQLLSPSPTSLPYSTWTFRVQDAISFVKNPSLIFIYSYLSFSFPSLLPSYSFPALKYLGSFSSILSQFYCLFLGPFDILHLSFCFFPLVVLYCLCSSFLILYLPF